MVIEKGTQVRVKIIGIRSEVGEMWAIGSIKEDYLGYVAAAFLTVVRAWDDIASYGIPFDRVLLFFPRFLADVVPIVAFRRVDLERQPGGKTIPPPVPKSLTELAVLLSRCSGQVALQTAWRNILA